jgi:hypothetical protein
MARQEVNGLKFPLNVWIVSFLFKTKVILLTNHAGH